MPKSKRRRTTITREAADRFSRKLEQLPDKPKTTLTPKELVFENAQQLEALLERNYEYDDLVDVLKADGIQISKTTLRQYLSEARKVREDQGKTASDKAHRLAPASTRQAKTSAPSLETPSEDKPAENAPQEVAKREPAPARKKIGKSRLQSEENTDRYPAGLGRPIEMKTEL